MLVTLFNIIKSIYLKKIIMCECAHIFYIWVCPEISISPPQECISFVKITWIKSNFRLIFQNESNQTELHAYIFFIFIFFFISVFWFQEKRQKQTTKDKKKLITAMINNTHTICHEINRSLDLVSSLAWLNSLRTYFPL